MENGQKKKKALLIHLSSAILYITVTSVCEKQHFHWISSWSVLREKDDWGTATRPKQSCGADVCLFLEQPAPASLRYCVGHRLKFWWAEWIHWALEMTATFSITCWIKERLLCLGVLLQHFVSLNVRPQGLIREKQMAHAFVLSFYLFSRGWFLLGKITVFCLCLGIQVIFRCHIKALTLSSSSNKGFNNWYEKSS